MKEVQSGSDMTRILNPRRNLYALEREARELLHDLRRMDPKAIQRYSSLDPLEWNSQPGLADTRYVVAREYGSLMRAVSGARQQFPIGRPA